MKIEVLATLVVIALVLAGSISCERWKFQECRKVGHSRTYCLFQIVEAK